MGCLKVSKLVFSCQNMRNNSAVEFRDISQPSATINTQKYIANPLKLRYRICGTNVIYSISRGTTIVVIDSICLVDAFVGNKLTNR
jgi:hypothetical protein